MKNKANTQKGITLVALVITIIVLLILAGVAIKSISDNDLIKESKKAVSATEIAKEKEALSLAIISAKLVHPERLLTAENLNSALSKNDAGAFLEENTIIAKFNKSGRYYEVNGKGNVGDPKELITDKHVGDITKGETLNGTEEKPYKINSIEDLVEFSIMTNGGNADLGIVSNTFTDKYVELVRTLDFKSIFSYVDYTTTKYGDLNSDGIVENIKTELTKTEEGCVGFTPITNFTGYFDGKGNEIQNIYIEREGSAALFVSSPKSIENVGVTGEITSTAGNAAGIVVGSARIESCWNKANITGNNYHVVGICTGSSGYDIKNCYNTGNITNLMTNPSNGSAGGILGVSGNIIENCYNIGDVSGVQYAGGIVGSSATEIRNCYNTGDITGVYGGGISSYCGKIIVNCYNTGNVSGGGTGGIAGVNSTSGAVISNCFNVAEVRAGNSNSYAGGIIGKNTTDIIINNSYNIGNLKAVAFVEFFGGIVASNQGTSITLNKCYYLKTEKATQAINGIDDSTLDVEQCTSVSEITAEKLNANRNTLAHDGEWREWVQGESYPIFK